MLRELHTVVPSNILNLIVGGIVMEIVEIGVIRSMMKVEHVMMTTIVIIIQLVKDGVHGTRRVVVRKLVTNR